LTVLYDCIDNTMSHDLPPVLTLQPDPFMISAFLPLKHHKHRQEFYKAIISIESKSPLGGLLGLLGCLSHLGPPWLKVGGSLLPTPRLWQTSRLRLEAKHLC
jgi:hypothetical protein